MEYRKLKKMIFLLNCLSMIEVFLCWQIHILIPAVIMLILTNYHRVHKINDINIFLHLSHMLITSFAFISGDKIFLENIPKAIFTHGSG